MHELVVFDTETTSCFAAKNGRPGGEVIQFAAIFINKDFSITRTINRYCSSTQLIDEQAEKVHGLSDKKISILSEDKFFERIVEEEKLRQLTNITWVGYNTAFDIRMSNQTLTQNGYESLDFGLSADLLSFNRNGIFKFDAMDSLCGINGTNYRVKLSELVAKHIGNDVFRKVCRKFRIDYNIVDPYIGQEDYFHNAFFDSLALLLLINKFRNSLFE